MLLRGFISLSTLFAIVMSVRIIDLPKLQAMKKYIPERHKGDHNNLRVVPIFETIKPPNQPHIPVRTKSLKNMGTLNTISMGQSPQRLERQNSEQVEQKIGSEQPSSGLDVWLNGLRGDQELPFEGDRVQFHIQGHKGPRTYIFGYDTGHGKNRQFRLEEMSENGTVEGQYGYYDPKGKLKTVKYVARPFEGYNERHHESNMP